MVTQNKNAQTTMIDPLKICPGNHTRLVDQKKKKMGGGGGGFKEKEDSEMLCLKALILSAIHLDDCDYRGRQHKGALSPSTEL